MVTQMSSEPQRLAALRNYDILDTPPDGAFDRIATLAARCFRTPIALVTLVDEDRIWFKSRHGLGVEQIPRSPGLCASAILSDAAYTVRDALTDVRTLANPLVTGALGLRFYAAAPLITHDGFRLGTINVIDFAPRDFSADDEKLLQDLSAMVVDLLELRLSARKTIGTLSQVLTGIKHPEELAKLVTVCAWTNKIRIGGRWISFAQFMGDELGLHVTHGMSPEAEEAFSKDLPSVE